MPDDWTGQDWGLTYDEIEPYYDQFEHIYGVGGKAGNLEGAIQPGGNPFEGMRSREFPNPASQRTYAGTLFAQAAQSLGKTPFQNPTAAMTSPYTNLYKMTLGQCVRGGFCNSHGCAMGAKAEPADHRHSITGQASELRAAHPHQRDARRSGLERQARHGRHLHRRAAAKWQQPAALVILASYTFNNTRLLLHSGIGKPY